MCTLEAFAGRTPSLRGKRSYAILKRTRGEAVGGDSEIGIVAFLLLLPAVLVLGLAVCMGMSGNLPIVLAVLTPVAVLFIVALMVVFGALGAIFRTVQGAPAPPAPALLAAACQQNRCASPTFGRVGASC